MNSSQKHSTGFNKTATQALKDMLNRPEFHAGTIINDWGVIAKALKDGADPETRSKYGETVMHDAARVGNIEIMQMALNYGANINALDDANQTPLRNANNKAALWLINHGADVNKKDLHGHTRLFKVVQEAILLEKLGIQRNHLEEITLLAAAGAIDSNAEVLFINHVRIKNAFEQGRKTYNSSTQEQMTENLADARG